MSSLRRSRHWLHKNPSGKLRKQTKRLNRCSRTCHRTIVNRLSIPLTASLWWNSRWLTKGFRGTLAALRASSRSHSLKSWRQRLRSSNHPSSKLGRNTVLLIQLISLSQLVFLSKKKHPILFQWNWSMNRPYQINPNKRKRLTQPPNCPSSVPATSQHLGNSYSLQWLCQRRPQRSTQHGRWSQCRGAKTRPMTLLSTATTHYELAVLMLRRDKFLDLKMHDELNFSLTLFACSRRHFSLHNDS